MQDVPTYSRRSAAIGVAVLIAVTAVLFALSVGERAPAFAHNNSDMAGAMTVGTTLFAKNWDREGALHLRFAMFWAPRSIETPDVQSRQPYSSYPSGAVLPIFWLGKLWGSGPTPALTKAWNLSNQAVIALLLGVMALLALLRVGFATGPATLWALAPALLYIYLPSPYYEHQCGYFADEAILLPFVAYVFLEMLRDSGLGRMRRAIDFAQAALAFWGCFTDYLFFFLLGCVFFARWIQGDCARGWKARLGSMVCFWTPAAVAVALFASQLAYLHAFHKLYIKLINRTGIDGGGFNALMPEPQVQSWSALFWPDFGGHLWSDFMPAAYGKSGLAALIFSAAILAAISVVTIWKHRGRASVACAPTAREDARPPDLWHPDALLLKTAFLLIAPCFLHYYALKNHSNFLFHFFAALKWAPSMALTPLVLTPALLLNRWYGPEKPLFRKIAWIFSVAFLGVAVVYTLSFGETRRAMYATAKYDDERIAKFIGAHTGFEDVVFSTDRIAAKHFNYYSNKAMHRTRSVVEMRDALADLSSDYAVGVFAMGDKATIGNIAIAGLTTKSFEVIHEGDLHLYKIHKQDFLAYMEELKRRPVPPAPGVAKP